MANDSCGHMLKVLHAKKKRCGCPNKFILITLKLHQTVLDSLRAVMNPPPSTPWCHHHVLTPKDVQPLKPTNWFLRGLWVIPVDLKEFLNRYLRERYKLRPLDKFVCKVKTKENGKVNISRDEIGGVPTAFQEYSPAVGKEEDTETNETNLER